MPIRMISKRKEKKNKGGVPPLKTEKLNAEYLMLLYDIEIAIFAVIQGKKPEGLCANQGKAVGSTYPFQPE